MKILCNKCGRELTARAGSDWSGMTKYQRYVCRCGHKQLNYHEPWIKQEDGSWISPFKGGK